MPPAANAPARNSTARSRASIGVSPVTWKRFLNTPWIVAVLMISSVLTLRFSVCPLRVTLSSRHSMKTVDINLPTLSRVFASIRSPPAESRVICTAGWPSFVKPELASTISSPDAITSRLSFCGGMDPRPEYWRVPGKSPATSTMRNSTVAVAFRIFSSSVGSWTPGNCTTMRSTPWRCTSGSATPS